MKIKKNFGEGNIEINNNFKKVYNGFNVVDNEYNEQKKSKKQTSDGVTSGSFPFFTSSNQQSLFDDEFMIDGSYLILGDGGDYPSLNYYNGKFSYSSHTLVLDYVHNDNLYMYYYWLKNINELDRCFQGSKLKNIKRSLFIKTKILVPSIENQKKISMILDQSSLNIKKIKELVERIEIRNKYYADKLLSGKLTVENNFLTENTDIDYNKSIKITEHIDIINGYPFKANEMSVSGDYAVIKMSNFKEGKVSILRNTLYTDNYIEKVRLFKNDLLIGLSGSVGEHAIFNLNETCLLNQRCIIIRNKDEIGDYVKTYIINKELEKLKNSGEGGVIKNVSSNYFQDMEIYLPKNYKEIMLFISKMNLEKYNIEKLLKLEKKRFEWLSDKLLSGEYIIED